MVSLMEDPPRHNCYLDKCIDTIVSGGVVDTIYFEIAKAVDSVPHERLLDKLL